MAVFRTIADVEPSSLLILGRDTTPDSSGEQKRVLQEKAHVPRLICGPSIFITYMFQFGLRFVLVLVRAHTLPRPLLPPCCCYRYYLLQPPFWFPDGNTAVFFYVGFRGWFC